VSGGEANGQAADALAYPSRGRRDLAEDAAVLDEASARARVPFDLFSVPTERGPSAAPYAYRRRSSRRAGVSRRNQHRFD
jgi:hypothetical protein